MCGRYYIEIDEKELRDIVNEVERSTQNIPGQMTLKTSGEIFPTDIVPVQIGNNEYQPMKWGFLGFDKRLVINAKSETALQKPMFRESMLERRCLIPATGYYEWEKVETKKIKYQFFIPNTPMYFAGCWRKEKDSPIPNFVILTRPAIKAFEKIHDRMPVIIPQNYMLTWLYESPAAMPEGFTELSFERVSQTHIN